MAHQILIREWCKEDAEALTILANNENIAGHLRDAFPYPYRIEHAYAFIEMARHGGEKKIFRAIEYNGVLAGSIGLHIMDDVYRKNAELGYWIGEPYWGKGIATFCIKKMVLDIFSSYDLRRIYAEVFADNSASRRVLEKVGFIHEATLRQNVFKRGRFIDTTIYRLLREEYKESALK